MSDAKFLMPKQEYQMCRWEKSAISRRTLRLSDLYLFLTAANSNNKKVPSPYITICWLGQERGGETARKRSDGPRGGFCGFIWKISFIRRDVEFIRHGYQQTAILKKTQQYSSLSPSYLYNNSKRIRGNYLLYPHIKILIIFSRKMFFNMLKTKIMSTFIPNHNFPLGNPFRLSAYKFFFDVLKNL